LGIENRKRKGTTIISGEKKNENRIEGKVNRGEI